MHFWSGTSVDPSKISDVKAYNKENAKMCYWVLEKKKEIFPITRGNGNKYLNYYAIEKYMKPAIEVENKVFEQANPIINQIREGKATAADLKPVYSIVEKVF